MNIEQEIIEIVKDVLEGDLVYFDPVSGDFFKDGEEKIPLQAIRIDSGRFLDLIRNGVIKQLKEFGRVYLYCCPENGVVSFDHPDEDSFEYFLEAENKSLFVFYD